MPIHNLELKREYQRNWLQNKRNKCIEILGGKCVKCGSTSNLEFHHKNPDEKLNKISSMLSYRWEILSKEILKCELQCYNCHRKFHGKL